MDSKRLALLNYLSEQRVCRPRVKGHVAEENAGLGSSSARDQASDGIAWGSALDYAPREHFIMSELFFRIDLKTSS